jgi:uncharacterized protein YecT (DUF1311 family)
MSKSAVNGGCLLIILLLGLGMACQNKEAVANATPLLITVERPVTVEVTRVEFVEVTAVPVAIAPQTTPTIAVSTKPTSTLTTTSTPVTTATVAATTTLDWQAIGVFTATFPILKVEPPFKLNCPGMTQLEMNFCAAHDAYDIAREVDALMTNLIQLSRSEEWVQHLLLSHEGWETYKKQECDWIAFHSEGGSIQPLIYWACIASENEERVQELRFTSCFVVFPSSRCDENN